MSIMPIIQQINSLTSSMCVESVLNNTIPYTILLLLTTLPTCFDKPALSPVVSLLVPSLLVHTCMLG